ncbi:MAG: LysM peptidoglycan-binding domain-containing protein [Bacillota bacterium]
MVRKPEECPENFQRQYVVQPGDTMYYIAQTFESDLDELIQVNSHISDPNIIYPGDLLCVPGKAPVDLPCALALVSQTSQFPDAKGIASVQFVGGDQYIVSVAAAGLPDEINSFNSYEGLVELPGKEGAFGFNMFISPNLINGTTVWLGSTFIQTIPGLTLSEGTEILVRPSNTETLETGDPILATTLESC